MKAKPATSVIRSKKLSRFTEIIHAMVVGRRVPIDARKGRNQPAFSYVAAFARRLGTVSPFVVLNRHVHSTKVRFVGNDTVGPQRADGMVTDTRGVILCAPFADCIPLLAYDPIAHVIGLAHSGRRGTVQGMPGMLIKTMSFHGARPNRTIVWIGPSAHPCCYSFDLRTHRKHYEPFMVEYGSSFTFKRHGRIHVNLQNAVIHDLERSGIARRNIEVDPTCTVHSSNRLPSNVRERGSRNRTLWALIGIRDPLENLQEKDVLVMGLGLHGGGVDVAKWLVRQGARVVVTDLKTRTQLKGPLKQLHGLPVRYVLGRHRFKDVDRTQLIIANPGVPRDSKYLRYAEKRSVAIENDASIFFGRCPAPIIGITGTKGKTTTTTLILAMLRRHGRHIVGVGYNEEPLMGALDRITPGSLVVAELSSWRLERLERHRRSPHIALCTNVMPDHLNRYDGFSDYARAKRIIFDHQRPDDIAILNRDNAVTRRFGASVHGARWWFSLHPFAEENGMFMRGTKIIMRSFGRETTVGTLSADVLRASHQASNVLAAALTARLGGASICSIRHVIAHLPVIPHRLERIRTVGGVTYINDSAATTPDAAAAALKAIKKPVILITGGTDKGLNFVQFARSLRTRCKDLVFLDGSATRKIVRAVPSLSTVPVVRTMRDAVRHARSLATKGDTVLLSPGAASFELFKHEFDRGDQFRAIIGSLRP